MTFPLYPEPGTASLAEPGGSSTLLAAVRWVEAIVLGPVATGIAVLAVAAIGFTMLSGRLPVRRGATVILGCFVLFGAPIIASGILGAARGDTKDVIESREAVAPPMLSPAITPSPASGRGYDPYAGAAVPPR